MTAADDALDAAIQAVVNELRKTSENEDQGVVTEWAVVAHTSSFDDEGHTASAYYIMFSNGSLADHRATGLLGHGIYMLRSGQSVSER